MLRGKRAVGERSFNVVGIGGDGFSEFIRIAHGEVCLFACERRYQVRGIASNIMPGARSRRAPTAMMCDGSYGVCRGQSAATGVRRLSEIDPVCCTPGTQQSAGELQPSVIHAGAQENDAGLDYVDDLKIEESNVVTIRSRHA